MWTLGHALLFLSISVPLSVGLMILLAKLESQKDKERDEV
jgi:hypothetical protein